MEKLIQSFESGNPSTADFEAAELPFEAFLAFGQASDETRAKFCAGVAAQLRERCQVKAAAPAATRDYRSGEYRICPACSCQTLPDPVAIDGDPRQLPPAAGGEAQLCAECTECGHVDVDAAFQEVE